MRWLFSVRWEPVLQTIAYTDGVNGYAEAAARLITTGGDLDGLIASEKC